MARSIQHKLFVIALGLAVVQVAGAAQIVLVDVHYQVSPDVGPVSTFVENSTTPFLGATTTHSEDRWDTNCIAMMGSHGPYGLSDLGEVQYSTWVKYTIKWVPASKSDVPNPSTSYPVKGDYYCKEFTEAHASYIPLSDPDWLITSQASVLCAPISASTPTALATIFSPLTYSHDTNSHPTGINSANFQTHTWGDPVVEDWEMTGASFPGPYTDLNNIIGTFYVYKGVSLLGYTSRHSPMLGIPAFWSVQSGGERLVIKSVGGITVTP